MWKSTGRPTRSEISSLSSRLLRVWSARVAVDEPMGIVTDPEKRPVGQIRDTVKLALNASQLVQRKNVQYNSGFVLPPGTYHLKIVVRENQTGRLGSFETDLTIPDLKSAPVKMSSIVLANQLETAPKRKTDNPLVRDGSEVIPSVTHVFSAGQHLYLYYEVYDPAAATTNMPIMAITPVCGCQG